jgi:FAD/FMN-containing dehydrogenase
MQIAADNNTVELGPGLTLFDAYSYLEPYNRVLIGGRLKTIGLAGLTLGGGVHYFINKYGYAMDNVLSYDVVIGNGTLVTANATQNADLFWALKGGSSNFGIVTKFTSKVYDIPQVSVVFQQWNESAVKDFCKAVVDLASLNDAEPIAAGGVIIINYNATTKEVTPELLGMQEGASLEPSQFANFSAIPSTSKFNNITTAAQWASTLDSPWQEYR